MVRRFRFFSGVSMAVLVTATACNPAKPSGEVREAPALAASSSPTRAAVTGTAEIGKPAPDFELRDLEGQTYRLSQFRGKTVVLEWFNPQCPFVKASHSKGSLHGLAEKYTVKGITWLAVNSAAPGRQGYGADANTEGKRKFGLTHPVLLDETGDVGHAYHATNTPHMFVVDDQGVLVYRGAIDNSPDGEGESPQGGALVNYVVAALDDLAAGRSVKTRQTDPYGCSVKYAPR
jgi:peroxiredoxin